MLPFQSVESNTGLGRKALKPGSIPTKFMPKRSVETVKPEARKPPVSPDDHHCYEICAYAFVLANPLNVQVPICSIITHCYIAALLLTC